MDNLGMKARNDGDRDVIEIDLSKIHAVRLVGPNGKTIASGTEHLFEMLEWLIRFVDSDTRITKEGVEERWDWL